MGARPSTFADSALYPASLIELESIVHDAIKKGYQICLVGSGLSQNDQNVGPHPQFVTVKLNKMNHVQIIPKTNTAIVTGNVTFQELETEANRYGLATKVRQASGIFGVISSISTNVHGWDYHAGCIGNTVEKIFALDSRGKRVVIYPGTADFKTVIGSYGGTFLIYSVEIQMTRNVFFDKVNKKYDTVNAAIKAFKVKSPNADMGLISVGRKSFILVLYYRTWKQDEDDLVTPDLDIEGPTGPYWERLLIDIVRLLTLFKLKWLLDWLFEWIVERSWMVNETMRRNELMNVRVNAINKIFTGLLFEHKFTLVEYFVHEQDLDDLITLFRKEFNDTFVFNASIRRVPRYENSYSSYSSSDDVYSFVICWDQRLTDDALLDSEERNNRFLDFLEERGGTFYMAYRNHPEDIEKFYPEFVKMLRRRPQPRTYSNAMIENILHT